MPLLHDLRRYLSQAVSDGAYSIFVPESAFDVGLMDPCVIALDQASIR
jgi:hypothetical protein